VAEFLRVSLARSARSATTIDSTTSACCISSSSENAKVKQATLHIERVQRGVIGGADGRCLPLAPRSRSLHVIQFTDAIGCHERMFARQRFDRAA